MIDYRLVSEAVDWYSRHRSYVEFDVPWLVGKYAYHATKPPEAKDLYVFNWDSYLVASGEQSFIEMLINGRDIKKAMCVTPCFRDDVTDDIHRKTFLKVELIKADEVSTAHLFSLMHDAMSFFEQYVSVKVKEIDKNRYDLICKESRIELGSYGIRHIAHPDGKSNDISWIYGTGLAEPRLSQAIKYIRERAEKQKVFAIRQ